MKYRKTIEIFDGALVIVIFTTSGTLVDVASKRTEDSVGDGREWLVAVTELAVGDRRASSNGLPTPASSPSTKPAP